MGLGTEAAQFFDPPKARNDAKNANKPDQVIDKMNEEQRVTLAFGISYETAVLRWFDRLPASMNTPG